jgi:hypothetical protein
VLAAWKCYVYAGERQAKQEPRSYDRGYYTLKNGELIPDNKTRERDPCNLTGDYSEGVDT